MKYILLMAISCTLLFGGEDKVVSSQLKDSIDFTNYKKIEHKNTKIDFDQNASYGNGIYNYTYSPNEHNTSKRKRNIFVSGYFDIIKRYKPLYFDGDQLTNESKKTLDKIINQIHTYVDNQSREIVVSIIGFTQKTENNNTEVSLDTGYTNFFQSVGQRDDLDPKEATKNSVNYMNIVYKKLLDNNISKEILYKENRVGKDALYTEEFEDGRELNNRVEVAIYVQKIIDPDTDGDGVKDSKDYCPKTPLGSSVDKHGCPFIMNLDLKFDFDKATISDKKSLDDIHTLSEFMKKYPVYHANIVGHTDSVGNVKYNQKLSLRRAKVVKEIMIKDGVESSRLSYEGKGESEPLFENINPINRHKNRRTEVELILPEAKSVHKKIVPRRRGI